MPPPPMADRLSDAAACLICLAKGTLDCPHVTQTPAEVRVLEMEAFGSVQDLIHASISGNGGRCTLDQVYSLCQSRGRIAYKRSSGSRLITQNEHWKSQIRHALYTNPRFERCPAAPCQWRLAPGRLTSPPSIVRVLVRADEPDAPALDPMARKAAEPSSGSRAEGGATTRGTTGGSAAGMAVPPQYLQAMAQRHVAFLQGADWRPPTAGHPNSHEACREGAASHPDLLAYLPHALGTSHPHLHLLLSQAQAQLRAAAQDHAWTTPPTRQTRRRC